MVTEIASSFSPVSLKKPVEVTVINPNHCVTKDIITPTSSTNLSSILWSLNLPDIYPRDNGLIPPDAARASDFPQLMRRRDLLGLTGEERVKPLKGSAVVDQAQVLLVDFHGVDEVVKIGSGVPEEAGAYITEAKEGLAGRMPVLVSAKDTIVMPVVGIGSVKELTNSPEKLTDNLHTQLAEDLIEDSYRGIAEMWQSVLRQPEYRAGKNAPSRASGAYGGIQPTEWLPLLRPGAVKAIEGLSVALGATYEQTTNAYIVIKIVDSQTHKVSYKIYNPISNTMDRADDHMNSSPTRAYIINGDRSKNNRRIIEGKNSKGQKKYFTLDTDLGYGSVLNEDGSPKKLNDFSESLAIATKGDWSLSNSSRIGEVDAKFIDNVTVETYLREQGVTEDVITQLPEKASIIYIDKMDVETPKDVYLQRQHEEMYVREIAYAVGWSDVARDMDRSAAISRIGELKSNETLIEENPKLALYAFISAAEHFDKSDHVIPERKKKIKHRKHSRRGRETSLAA